MEEMLTAVSTVGFPIAVASYLLIRVERTVKNNTKVITMLAAKMGVNADESN